MLFELFYQFAFSIINLSTHSLISSKCKVHSVVLSIIHYLRIINVKDSNKYSEKEYVYRNGMKLFLFLFVEGSRKEKYMKKF